MQIFLSARYELRDTMKQYAEFLIAGGHEVPAKWLWEDQMDFTGMNSIPANPGESYAWDDFFDVRHCDVFICFTEDQDQPKGRGGRHVEFGFAWTMEKPIIIVGPNETVFHSAYVGDIWRMENWDEDLITEYLDMIDDYMYKTKPRDRRS